jgi:hypothetical protein
MKERLRIPGTALSIPKLADYQETASNGSIRQESMRARFEKVAHPSGISGVLRDSLTDAAHVWPCRVL